MRLAGRATASRGLKARAHPRTPFVSNTREHGETRMELASFLSNALVNAVLIALGLLFLSRRF